MTPTNPEDLFRAEKQRSMSERSSTHAQLLAEAKAAFDKLMAEGQAARKSGRPRKNPIIPARPETIAEVNPAPAAKPKPAAKPAAAKKATPAKAKKAAPPKAKKAAAKKPAPAKARKAAPAKGAAKKSAGKHHAGKSKRR
ncbi:MAG TPA: hypothetical protein VG818_08335 [Gemmatimonadaceae bacterium]|jgi:hypothetical protein|nr:hypothetical protein [Gemmatimonadaceae bacterium]